MELMLGKLLIVLKTLALSNLRFFKISLRFISEQVEIHHVTRVSLELHSSNQHKPCTCNSTGSLEGAAFTA